MVGVCTAGIVSSIGVRARRIQIHAETQRTPNADYQRSQAQRDLYAEINCNKREKILLEELLAIQRDVEGAQAELRALEATSSHMNEERKSLHEEAEALRHSILLTAGSKGIDRLQQALKDTKRNASDAVKSLQSEASKLKNECGELGARAERLRIQRDDLLGKLQAVGLASPRTLKTMAHGLSLAARRIEGPEGSINDLHAGDGDRPFASSSLFGAGSNFNSSAMSAGNASFLRGSALGLSSASPANGGAASLSASAAGAAAGANSRAPGWVRDALMMFKKGQSRAAVSNFGANSQLSLVQSSGYGLSNSSANSVSNDGYYTAAGLITAIVDSQDGGAGGSNANPSNNRSGSVSRARSMIANRLASASKTTRDAHAAASSETSNMNAGQPPRGRRSSLVHVHSRNTNAAARSNAAGAAAGAALSSRASPDRRSAQASGSPARGRKQNQASPSQQQQQQRQSHSVLRARALRQGTQDELFDAAEILQLDRKFEDGIGDGQGNDDMLGNAAGNAAGGSTSGFGDGADAAGPRQHQNAQQSANDTTQLIARALVGGNEDIAHFLSSSSSAAGAAAAANASAGGAPAHGASSRSLWDQVLPPQQPQQQQWTDGHDNFDSFNGSPSQLVRSLHPASRSHSGSPTRVRGMPLHAEARASSRTRESSSSPRTGFAAEAFQQSSISPMRRSGSASSSSAAAGGTDLPLAEAIKLAEKGLRSSSSFTASSAANAAAALDRRARSASASRAQAGSRASASNSRDSQFQNAAAVATLHHDPAAQQQQSSNPIKVRESAWGRKQGKTMLQAVGYRVPDKKAIGSGAVSSATLGLAMSGGTGIRPPRPGRRSSYGGAGSGGNAPPQQQVGRGSYETLSATTGAAQQQNGRSRSVGRAPASQSLWDQLQNDVDASTAAHQSRQHAPSNHDSTSANVIVDEQQQHYDAIDADASSAEARAMLEQLVAEYRLAGPAADDRDGKEGSFQQQQQHQGGSNNTGHGKQLLKVVSFNGEVELVDADLEAPPATTTQYKTSRGLLELGSPTPAGQVHDQRFAPRSTGAGGVVMPSNATAVTFSSSHAVSSGNAFGVAASRQLRPRASAASVPPLDVVTQGPQQSYGDDIYDDGALQQQRQHSTVTRTTPDKLARLAEPKNRVQTPAKGLLRPTMSALYASESGVLHTLDEPPIQLSPRDKEEVINGRVPSSISPPGLPVRVVAFGRTSVIARGNNNHSGGGEAYNSRDHSPSGSATGADTGSGQTGARRGAAAGNGVYVRPLHFGASSTNPSNDGAQGLAGHFSHRSNENRPGTTTRQALIDRLSQPKARSPSPVRRQMSASYSTLEGAPAGRFAQQHPNYSGSGGLAQDPYVGLANQMTSFGAGLRGSGAHGTQISPRTALKTAQMSEFQAMNGTSAASAAAMRTRASPRERTRDKHVVDDGATITSYAQHHAALATTLRTAAQLSRPQTGSGAASAAQGQQQPPSSITTFTAIPDGADLQTMLQAAQAMLLQAQPQQQQKQLHGVRRASTASVGSTTASVFRGDASAPLAHSVAPPQTPGTETRQFLQQVSAAAAAATGATTAGNFTAGGNVGIASSGPSTPPRAAQGRSRQDSFNQAPLAAMDHHAILSLPPPPPPANVSSAAINAHLHSGNHSNSESASSAVIGAFPPPAGSSPARYVYGGGYVSNSAVSSQFAAASGWDNGHYSDDSGVNAEQYRALSAHGAAAPSSVAGSSRAQIASTLHPGGLDHGIANAPPAVQPLLESALVDALAKAFAKATGGADIIAAVG